MEEVFFGLVERINYFHNLQNLCRLAGGSAKVSDLPEGIAKATHTHLDAAEQIFRSLDFDAALDRIQRIRLCLGVNCALDVIDSEVRVLLETIQDQSRRRWFKYISPQKVDWYNAPEQFFPASSKAFPSATHDIQEACCSFALERYTACVFHCMGIFQRGLYAFAQEKDIQVSFPFPIELAEWKNIIDNIESKIRALESLPKGQQKDEKLKFYSDAAVQFRYFKDAWRNHIAHFREQYDEHMALSILIHVRDFIEHLSTRLSELPVPGSTQPETLP